MDKNLVDGVKALMPMPSSKHIPYYLPHHLDTSSVDKEMTSPFSFMAGVQKDATKATNTRRKEIGGFLIPHFDPFNDHLTTLVLRDVRVIHRLTRLLIKEEIEELSGKAWGDFKLDMNQAQATGLGRGKTSLDMWLPPYDCPYQAISPELIKATIDKSLEKK